MIVVAGDVLRSIRIDAAADATSVGPVPAAIEFSIAGQGARTAAWLGHQGVTTTLLAKVGPDDRESMTNQLTQYGVTPHFVASTRVNSGVLAYVTDANSPMRHYVDLDQAAQLDQGDVSDDLFTEVGWLHLSGYLFYEPHVRAAARRLIEMAKQSGAGISVDPGSATHLRTVSAEAFIEWTNGVDLIFPNLDETRVLVGATGPFIDFEQLVAHYPHAAVTLGAMGSAYVGSNVREQVAASRVDVVDQSGVGDAYSAGFLAAWVTGADPKTALSQGNALAQACLGRSGSLP